MYLEPIEINSEMHETRKHEKGNGQTRPVKCQGKKEENSFSVGKPLVLIIIRLTGRRRVGSGRVRLGDLDDWHLGRVVLVSNFVVWLFFIRFRPSLSLDQSQIEDRWSRDGPNPIKSKDFFWFFFSTVQTKWWWISVVVSAHVCGRIIADQSQASPQSADRWHWISSSPEFILNWTFKVKS